jgi:uncharacterized protein YbjT (DUF2867 family)
VADLDKPDTLAGACHRVWAMYVIARTDQVRGMVDLAKGAGVRHIVRQSTMEAGFDPPVGPGRWHREAELVIERSGIPYTHLRPTMIMANTLAWWRRTSGRVRWSSSRVGKAVYPLSVRVTSRLSPPSS